MEKMIEITIEELSVMPKESCSSLWIDRLQIKTLRDEGE